MSRPLQILASTILALIGLAAHAGDKITVYAAPELRQEALTIPQNLLQQNIENIGDIDLKALVEEMGKITYTKTPYFMGGSGDKNRTTSIYLVEEKQIIFSMPSLPQVLPETMAPQILHESVGALGYPDENYPITLILYFKSLGDKNPLSQKIIDQFTKHLTREQKNRIYKSNGGITSIGGGGDHLGLGFKMQSLTRSNETCAKYNLTQERCDAFKTMVLNANVEVDHENQMRHDVSLSRELILLPMLPLLLQAEEGTLYDPSTGKEVFKIVPGEKAANFEKVQKYWISLLP